MARLLNLGFRISSSILFLALIICGVIYNFYFLFIPLILFVIEFIIFIFNFKGEVFIKTPEGSNQPYHPSVLYFKDGWKGYKYWMAYTPMPLNKQPYTDRWECPCVICSNDGKNWRYPGVMKVLDDLTNEQIAAKDYFSDPHLTYNLNEDCIYLYYRISEGDKPYKDITIFLIKSFDGITWSAKTKINYIDKSIKNHRPTSPAFIYINDSSYFMWYVEGGDKKIRKIFCAKSNNGIDWGKETACIFDRDINPWHIDVVKIDDKFYLTVYEHEEKVSLFVSQDGINYSFVKLLLIPSKRLGSFYKQGLYRTCLIKDDKGYKAYFSAKDNFRTSIGLLQGETPENMEVISVTSYLKYKRFLRDFAYRYLYLYIRIFKEIAK